MNPLLEKTEAATLQKAKPQYVAAIQKVVFAGKKVMYDPKSRDMAMSALKQGTDPETIGSAVAKLIGILLAHTKGTMPAEVFVPASTILLCEGLQFLEDAGVLKVTPDFLAQCTKATGSAILQLLGVTPEKMQQMLAQKGQQPGATPPAAPGAAPTTPAAPAAQAAPQPGIVGGAMQ